MEKLSHIDNSGKANMVDVSEKAHQKREAIASGFISLSPATIELIKENNMKKGDVLTTAEIAGIQSAKQTGTLIPLCHPLLLTSIKVKTELKDNGVEAIASIGCVGQTGVEMEALTAVSVCLLAVYDMCKAVDKQMEISEIKLLKKTKVDL